MTNEKELPSENEKVMTNELIEETHVLNGAEIVPESDSTDHFEDGNPIQELFPLHLIHGSPRLAHSS